MQELRNNTAIIINEETTEIKEMFAEIGEIYTIKHLRNGSVKIASYKGNGKFIDVFTRDDLSNFIYESETEYIIKEDIRIVKQTKDNKESTFKQRIEISQENFRTTEQLKQERIEKTNKKRRKKKNDDVEEVEESKVEIEFTNNISDYKYYMYNQKVEDVIYKAFGTNISKKTSVPYLVKLNEIGLTGETLTDFEALEESKKEQTAEALKMADKEASQIILEMIKAKKSGNPDEIYEQIKAKKLKEVYDFSSKKLNS